MITKEEISMLNTNNFLEGVSIIEKYWNQDYGTFDMEGKDGIITLVLTTGGWSENEAIIDILANKAFWFLWWQESKRGGYYKFIYTEKMAKEEDSILSKEEIEKAKKIIRDYQHDYLQEDIGIVPDFEMDKALYKIFRYIKELESDKQKLIEKLEERKKQNV